MNNQNTSARNLIDSLKVEFEHYSKQLDLLDKKIMDIRAGEEVYKNLSQIQKNKSIENIRNQKKELIETIKECQRLVGDIETLSNQLEKSTEKAVLLSEFIHSIDKVMTKDDKAPTLTHKEFKIKYEKFYIKELKELEKTKHKAKKELYKLLKAKANKFKVAIDKQDKIERVSDLEYLDYMDDLYFQRKTLKDRIEQGKNIFLDPKYQKISHYDEEKHEVKNAPENYTGYGSLERFVNEISGEKWSKMSDESIKDGGNFHQLNKLKEEYNNNELYLGLYGNNAKDKLDEINRYKNQYHLNINNQNLDKAIRQYKEIVEISKDVEYLKEVIKIFKETSIVNTETFQNIVTLCEEQEKKVGKLIIEADREYYKSGIEAKINAEQKLREIYSLIVQKEYRLNQYKKKNNIDRKIEYEISRLEEELKELYTKQFNILYENPELDKMEYKVDIKEVLKEEKKEQEEIKKSIQQQGNIHNQTQIKETKIAKNEELEVTKEESIKYDNYKVVDKEIRENWQEMRSAYYQEYCMKMMISKKKIPFSEFLEKRVPHLKELIELEKERERHATNIYKEYIIYLANEENKENAMKFSEFAKRKHRIENIDVPTQYEEYDQSIRRR